MDKFHNDLLKNWGIYKNMKHLKEFKEVSGNNPLKIFTANDHEAFVDLLNENENVASLVSKNFPVGNRAYSKQLWEYYYKDKVFCVYAPMDGLDDVVTYDFYKSQPSDLYEIWGSGERWKDEYYNGEQTKTTFWALVHQDEYQYHYAQIALDLIMEGNLGKFAECFGFFKGLEYRMSQLVTLQGLSGDILKRVKAAKLLLRK